MIASAIGASDQNRYATVIPRSHGARPGSRALPDRHDPSVLAIARVWQDVPCFASEEEVRLHPRTLGTWRSR